VKLGHAIRVVPIKLTRPTVPHAAVTERVIRQLRAMSIAEVRATFVRSGILRPDGTLAPPYDGTELPVDEKTG
jgi:hypothetical protein